MKDNNKILKNINNNCQILYSLFDTEGMSYCIINKSLNLSIRINKDKIKLSTAPAEDNYFFMKNYCVANNISEYLSYIKNYLNEVDQSQLYPKFLNSEFREKFPSFIYECAMIRKLHNQQLSHSKTHPLKHKIK